MPTPVKELVGLYESKSPTSPSLPSPSPARFLRHPARRESAPIVGAAVLEKASNPFQDDKAEERSSRRTSLPASSSALASAATQDNGLQSQGKPAYSSMGTRTPNQTNRRYSMDTAARSSTRNDSPSAQLSKPPHLHSEVTNVHELSSSPLRITTPSSPITSKTSRAQLRPNLPKSPYSPVSSHEFYDNDTASSITAAWSSRFIPLSKTSTSTYLPLDDLSNKRTPKAKGQTASEELMPLHSRRRPIPAKDVFSRRAVPLYLPHLDELLSQIPPPKFDTNSLATPISSKGKRKGKPNEADQNGMFPPLHKLQGKTLDDLQHNSSVPSIFNDRNFILNSIITSVIGVAGSSAIANYYSLQGLYDSIQIFALILSSVVPNSSLSFEDKWRNLFLSTIPNILALNIPTKLTQSLIFLAIFTVISGILLHRFYVGTSLYSPSAFREGLQARHPPSPRGIIAVSFILTVLYLPLSTIAVHGLLWSSDFWVVPNPYTNGTASLAELEPLGPPDEWRDPLDFCFTTTMRKDEVNYAPVIVAMSAITFIFMTIWFPIRLMQTIRQSLPRVDPYTELGRKRTKPEMELEYQRLLERDQNPFGFLYNEFRRSWGTYKSIYLWAKLSALLIVAILSPDNCAFRSLDREVVDIVRQSVLTASMLIWFLLQCFLVPFVDPVSNASEWISRLNYLVTSAIGLWASLDSAASSVLNGVVLYVIYVLTYGLDFYFAIIMLSFMRRFVKRLTQRVDFSIDIFSPKLDLSASSPHLRRRIWQESIGTLILTEEACRIPAKQVIQFSEPEKFEWPPYLLDFHGKPGERHVENLKILREEGLKKYARAIAMISGPEAKLFRFLKHRIQAYHIGPDSYWRPFDKVADSKSHRNFYGNAWWIPFPPTLVICYDVGGHAVLNHLHEFEHYLSQNEDPQIRRRREMRMALRALDKQIVLWPYTHIEPVGSRRWFTGPQYSMQFVTHFQSCVFSIKRHGIQYWKDLPLGSGFDVEMTYTKNIHLDGDAIGLDDEMEMTPTLAKFLHLNRDLVQVRLELIQEGIAEYRTHSRREAELKQRMLSYEFLTQVYNWPLQHIEVIKTVENSESDLRVRDLFAASEDSLDLASQRMHVTGRSEITVWWYLFWDDFWRRNYNAIVSLQKYESDFNPHYANSVAYRPLPRAAMEAFLIQRGMLSPKGRVKNAIYHGLLNKFYFRLNQIAFHNTNNAILVHVGNTPEEVDLNDVDLTTHVRSSSMGTGGGTDLDDAEIRARPAFKWEDVFDDPMHEGGVVYWRYLDWRRWKGIFAVWFGITPLEHRKLRSNGIALDVMLDNSGRYIVIERSRGSTH